MGVVVVEPRQERPPREIDHAGRGSDLVPHLIVAANTRDAITDDRHRFGDGLDLIDGDHGAIQENKIGGHRWAILCLLALIGRWHAAGRVSDLLWRTQRSSDNHR